MILDIDAGNTRVKWRLRTEDGRPLQQGDFSQADGVLSAFHELQQGEVTAVRLASVAAVDKIAEMTSRLEARFNVPVQLVQTIGKGPVQVAYDVPSRLGVDRWLAMLAARDAAKKAVLVIDCGTALTIDIVDADGRHAGGYIIPGYHLMRQALSKNTGQVRFGPETEPRGLQPADSTLHAVNSGALLALVGAVVHVHDEQLGGSVGAGLEVYLTGGDAARLSPHLPFAHKCCPDLVLDGLWVADSLLKEFG